MDYFIPPVLKSYFGVLTGGSGVLPGVAWIGLVSLLVGIVWGIDKRQPRLLWFLVPLALSELADIVAFSLDGMLGIDRWAAAVGWGLLVYIPVQGVVLIRILYLLHRQGALMPGLLVGGFVAIYALIPVLILTIAVAATD
ncbi:MAG: hypothetical protein ACLFWF_11305 [Alphaproteobacteria bacterium]